MGARASMALSSTISRPATKRSRQLSPTRWPLYATATGNLALERYVAQPELNAQCVFVDRFEKPRSECLVHLDRRSDDLRCYAIKLSVRFPSSRWRPGVLALHTSAFGHVAAKLPPN